MEDLTQKTDEEIAKEMADLKAGQDELKQLAQELLARKKAEGGEEDKEEEPESKKEKKGKKLTPEEEINNFISEFKLGTELPPEFEKLDEAQKLKTVRDLKMRVVDIIKDDAQTEYSEYLKSKMKSAAPSSGKFNKILTAVKNAGIGLKESFKKETEVKNLENKMFLELQSFPSGKELIKGELAQLTKINAEKNIYLNNKNETLVSFEDQLNIEKPTLSQKGAMEDFNLAANKFRTIPYEWGQASASRGQRKQYKKAEKKYEEARGKILEIKEEKQGKSQALLEVLQLDNGLQLDQLLNTHPEYEKELLKLNETAGGRERLKTAGNFLRTVTGGKNRANKIAFAAGFIIRGGTKIGTTIITGMKVGAGTLSASSAHAISTGVGLAAAPIFGAAFGGIRGRIRAKETLRQRQKEARHGKEDESKEAKNIVDAENLTKRMETMIKAVENATTPEKKAQYLDQLKRRINYTQDKVEAGLVNFGNAKSALNNQFNLLDKLNNSLVTSASLEKTTRTDVDAKLKDFLSFKEEGINKAQKEYVRKQMLRGAKIGAGAAVLGYVVRWFGEEQGWWGHHGVENVTQKTAEAGTTTPTGNGEGFMDRAEKWVEEKWDNIPKFWEHIERPSIDPTKTHHFMDTPNTKGGVDIDLLKKPKVITDSTGLAREDSIAKLTKVLPKVDSQKTLDLAQKAATHLKTNVVENVKDSSHAIETNFSVTLGKGGVPPHLETAYNEISANSLGLPANGQVNEEFATKSLNIAANLVKLTEGHNIGNINAEDFAKAVSFKDGVLEIKDHVKFNEVVSQLKGRADSLWDKGILESKGAAITYIPKISKGGWLDIAHGKGMHEAVVDGTKVSTGITGHPNIEAHDITDFNKSELVHKAMIEGGVSGTKKLSPEDLLNGDDAIKEEDFSSNLDKSLPVDYGEGLSPGEKAHTLLDAKEIAGISAGANSKGTAEDLINHQVSLTENNPFHLPGAMLVQVDKIYETNLDHLFPKGMDAWNEVKFSQDLTPTKILTIEDPKALGLETYSPFIKYIHTLHENTGMEPIEASAFRLAETNSEYVRRMLQYAASKSQVLLEKLTL